MRCYNMLCIFNQRNTCQKAEIQIGEFGECMQKVPLGNEERETLLMVRRDLNIENMVNKGKKDVAYTLLDVTGPVSAQLAQRLEAIPSVVRVRVL